MGTESTRTAIANVPDQSPKLWVWLCEDTLNQPTLMLKTAPELF